MLYIGASKIPQKILKKYTRNKLIQNPNCRTYDTEPYNLGNIEENKTRINKQK